MKYVLVATVNSHACDVIGDCFASDYRVEAATSFETCFEMFQSRRYEYVFLDVDLLEGLRQEKDHKSILLEFWRIFPSVEIIALSSQEMIREAVNAVKAGASDYLTFPIDPYEVRLITENIEQDVRLQSELDYLRDKFWRGESLAFLRTNTPAMKEVFSKVRAVAATESTVLLVGETGTGKGVIANLIHQHSARRENQFISVHCGAIPETLLESELFGHEKGAFTGAVRRKLGRFEIAQNGTIFLDEIGTISTTTQIKLLQVLQDRTFQRVGGETKLTADARIISASNEDLQKLCEAGKFRADLYYRLNVFPIEIPPLRERKDDIPLLVEAILNKLNRFGTKTIRDIDPKVLPALRNYSWPGNIRELENLLERAYIVETSPILTANSFPSELLHSQERVTAPSVDTSSPLAEIRRQHVERVERQYLIELLTQHSGRINRCAQSAGVGVRQMHKLLTKYKIRKEDFKVSGSKPIIRNSKV